MKPMDARNGDIFDQVKVEGHRQSDVARMYGISAERVRQIVASYERRIQRVEHWGVRISCRLADGLQKMGYSSLAEVKMNPPDRKRFSKYYNLGRKTWWELQRILDDEPR